jgi:hypothetical protein
MHIYRLPKRFPEDHWGRELVFEGDWVVHESKQHVYVRLSAEGAHDMISDADYYSDHRDFDPPQEFLGLCASARATKKAMLEQRKQIDETGSTEWDGKYEVTPEYCSDCNADITCMTRYAGGRCWPCHNSYWQARMQERIARTSQ